MGQTHFTRYWIATTVDGEEYAKFDLDGTEHYWPEIRDKQFKMVRYVPFTPKQAFLVRQRGNNASALPLETFVFDVPVGENIEELFARNFLKIETKYFCLACKRTFDHYDIEDECPYCYTRNEWWCTECNDLDDYPIIEGHNVLCSTCKSKQRTTGLQRIENIKEFSQEIHEHFHICIIGGKVYRIYTDHYEED